MNKKKEEIATTLNRFHATKIKSDWNEKQSRIRRRRRSRSRSLYKPNNCCCITQNLLSLSLPLSLFSCGCCLPRAFFLLASRKRLDKPVFCVLFFFVTHYLCYCCCCLLIFNVLSVSCSYQWKILTRNCSFLRVSLLGLARFTFLRNFFTLNILL